MSKWVIVALMCSGLIAACTSTGSGVSGSKPLLDLNNAEIADLCEYFVDLFGPARTVDCGGGLTITVGGGSVAECIEDVQDSQDTALNCTADVFDAEFCAEDLADIPDEELCDDGPLPSSCTVLIQCGDIL